MTSLCSPIIFIHIPKTAGTSFRIGLQQALGHGAVLLDYGDDAAETDAEILDLYQRGVFDAKLVAEIVARRNIRVLCGHFPLAKYHAVFPEAKIVSFVREPLQRCYSEFLHWQRHKGSTKTFTEFFHQGWLVNGQSQLLNGMPDKSLVGITEQYDTSLRIVNEELGLAIPSLSENCFREQTTLHYGTNHIPAELAAEFYRVNRKDLGFYQEQVKHFWERKAKLKFWDSSLLPRAVRKSRQALAFVVGKLR